MTKDELNGEVFSGVCAKADAAARAQSDLAQADTQVKNALLHAIADALDADALARAVLQVLHSPDGGTAMGRAARARALQTHDAARNTADLLHIYESILQEEHP